MKLFNRIIIAVALLISVNAYSQNLTTSVQGILRDNLGHSVENGQYSLTFKLYSQEVGGIAVWTETQTSEITYGIYSVELGKTTSLPTLDAGISYHLSVSVNGGAEMLPRIKLQKAFAANITAALGGSTNKVPSTGLARIDSIKFTDNSVARTADPNKIGIPVGGIIMWSGSTASIPSNWKICDGTNGTPNLMDRFVVGAGSSYAVGYSGGSQSHTLTTAQMPSHSHTGSAADNGSHYHTFTDNTWSSQYFGSGSLRGSNGTEDTDNSSGSGVSNYTSTTGSHSHTITVGSTGGGEAFDKRPPYYALYYIMKISN